MAAIAETGHVTLPAYIEVGDEMVRIGDIVLAVDVRGIRYGEDGLNAVLDLTVED